MNAVEIEEAISQLAEEEFDAEEFPYAFLEAFGNKATTLKRLKSGSSNASDVEGGVLQRNNIHIAVCDEGAVTETLDKLKSSPATQKAKAKYVLATDGITFEAEDLNSGETVACAYPHFPDHFGFFLSLAGISTFKDVQNVEIDIKATGRLNRLYVELLKDNEDWASDARRHDMNQFMARLIFCFFAEDTDIFRGDDLFTSTVEQMSDSRSDNTQDVIAELFRAMDTKLEDRDAAKLPRWACVFPWVNGGLFAGGKEIPKFSRIARSYLLHAGRLDWKKINPDIFGSMIQAVADDDERDELGMHYTSVPNILKVLNPLFLDDLNEQLELAGDNPRKLLNLRKRISSIRVFDPACGSGNFLVIAYIRMREIEAEIVRRRGEPIQKSWIELENFYGIELKDFAAEVARLSLLIAEFQCDVRLIGQKEAKMLMLPLKNTGQIRQGNALRLDWLEVCPPTRLREHIRKDLFDDIPEQVDIDFDARDSETYICGNPPFAGVTKQTDKQKEDLELVFRGTGMNWKSLDYVCGFFFKSFHYTDNSNCKYALVSTNSISQGQTVPYFWKFVISESHRIRFAYTSFPWKNLAKNNAGVIVVIIGLDRQSHSNCSLYSGDQKVACSHISPYLIAANIDMVSKSRLPISKLPVLGRGSIPNCGGNFILSSRERDALFLDDTHCSKYISRYVGSQELSKGIVRYCLVLQERGDDWQESKGILERVNKVREVRLKSKKKNTCKVLSKVPSEYEFLSSKGTKASLAIPRTTSVNRKYLAADILPDGWVVSDNAYFIEEPEPWLMSIVVSRLHLVWIATVCGKMKNDYRYSNTLGWNTFPIPTLTEKNKEDLTRCAEDILLAREAHFPATIADLYDSENMPEDLRHAHERNDEVLERIYIGRRFKNDTERLEKLFDLYTKMATEGSATKKAKNVS